MKLVTFSDENGDRHIGSLVGDEQSIAILQTDAQTMDGAPSPFFSDMLAFLHGGREARDKAHRVTEFILTESPPSSTVSIRESGPGMRPGNGQVPDAWR